MSTALSDANEDVISRAARWLAGEAAAPAHVVPTLKARFGLSSLQACQAIALARGAVEPEGRRA